MPKKTFTTIKQIQAHKFAGNYSGDESAFDAIHAFVSNTKNSLGNRAEALRVLSDKGLGCGRDETVSDANLVAEFLEDDGREGSTKWTWSVGSEQDAPKGKAEAIILCASEAEAEGLIAALSVIDPEGVEQGLYSINPPV